MGNVNASAFGTADQRAARVDHKSIEMTLGALRLLAAAAILLLGPAVPNVGPLFVLVLGVFFAGYGLLVMLAWVRVRSSADRERASRFSLAADISLIGNQPADRTASGLWPSDHAGVAATLRLPSRQADNR